MFHVLYFRKNGGVLWYSQDAVCCATNAHTANKRVVRGVRRWKTFWAGQLSRKKLRESKEQRHCGECNEFVCSLLHTFAYDEEQGDGGKRLEQCKLWKQEKREYKGEDHE